MTIIGDLIMLSVAFAITILIIAVEERGNANRTAFTWAKRTFSDWWEVE